MYFFKKISLSLFPPAALISAVSLAVCSLQPLKHFPKTTQCVSEQRDSTKKITKHTVKKNTQHSVTVGTLYDGKTNHPIDFLSKRLQRPIEGKREEEEDKGKKEREKE